MTGRVDPTTVRLRIHRLILDGFDLDPRRHTPSGARRRRSSARCSRPARCRRGSRAAAACGDCPGHRRPSAPGPAPATSGGRWRGRSTRGCSDERRTSRGPTMAQLTNTPRLVKGALIGVDLFNPIASVIVFQYNPATVDRTVTPQGASDEGSKAESMRLQRRAVRDDLHGPRDRRDRPAGRGGGHRRDVRHLPAAVEPRDAGVSKVRARDHQHGADGDRDDGGPAADRPVHAARLELPASAPGAPHRVHASRRNCTTRSSTPSRRR